MSATETTATDEEYRSEVWIYIGRGIDRETALTHRWLDTHQHVRLFSKVGHACVIGGRYELPVKHIDDTNASILAG